MAEVVGVEGIIRSTDNALGLVVTEIAVLWAG